MAVNPAMTNADDFAPAIRRMVSEIDRLEREAAELKRTVNKMCGFADQSPMYQDVEDQRRIGTSAIRSDQFFGLQQATAVRRYLEMRGNPNDGGLGAATVNEIYEAMVAGGFQFEAKNDENAKRGLRISLTKNSRDFCRVPNGAYGLLDWYPNVRKPAESSTTGTQEPNESIEPEAPPATDETASVPELESQNGEIGGTMEERASDPEKKNSTNAG